MSIGWFKDIETDSDRFGPRDVYRLTIDKEIAVLVGNVYRSWNEGPNASTRTRKLWVNWRWWWL
jgi:hypothetical protein